MLNKILKFSEKIVADLKINQQRMLIAFHVEAKSRQSAVDFLTNSLPYKSTLIISAELKNGLPPERASTKLGEEYELVVFDASSSFNPDALGVVSGVLCGGGCLLLVLPEKNQWLNDSSLFKQHVNSLLNFQKGVYYFNNEMDGGYFQKNSSEHVSDPVDFGWPYRSFDQQYAVEKIDHLLQSENNCCCVLTSGRGRGKSSALGLLSAKIVQRSNMTVLLTAPRLSVANPVFQQLNMQCPDGIFHKSDFEYKSSKLSFIAPDLLLETLPVADVLLVDEAAVIPVSMLKQLLKHYSRIIFSTTTHGYEGTGRGFVLKFYRLLDYFRPGWEKLELHQPIRWSKDDPLEKWMEKLLFLNIQLDSVPEMPASVKACQLKLINREKLIENKEEQSAVFSLLVFAHYRTSPSDFQYLLDSQNIRIYTLEYKQRILAVLVINQEGGFDAQLSTAIYRGERRPKGHLLAQTLCFHAGYEAAASLKYARVMRLAVHPDLQQRGLGSYLLRKVIEKEKTTGLDIIGSSFSATSALLNFWDKAGLSILRLGFSRDHVTAAHSAVVAKALSSDGSRAVRVLTEKFQRNLLFWLDEPLANLSIEVKAYVLSRFPASSHRVSKEDMQDIESFALFNRNYEACMPAIKRWLQKIDISHSNLSELDHKIIGLRMSMNNWADIVKALNLSGKTEAAQLLRKALKSLLASANN